MADEDMSVLAQSVLSEVDGGAQASDGDAAQQAAADEMAALQAKRFRTPVASGSSDAGDGVASGEGGGEDGGEGGGEGGSAASSSGSGSGSGSGGVAGSGSAKIAKGMELKAEGNAFFKAGDYKKARRAYASVFCYIDGMHGPNSGMKQYVGADDTISTEQEAEVEVLRATVQLNLAMVFLKLGKARRALDFTGKVLAKDPSNAKALYRSAMAWMEVGDLDKARALFGDVPDAAGVKKQLSILARKEKILEKKERKKYSGMFG